MAAFDSAEAAFGRDPYRAIRAGMHARNHAGA